MNLNKDALKNLLNNSFSGNFTKMAKALNVNVAQLYRILEKGSNAGAKFFGRLMAWCKENNEDFSNYIFLQQPLTAVNGKEDNQLKI